MSKDIKKIKKTIDDILGTESSLTKKFLLLKIKNVKLLIQFYLDYNI